MRTKEEIEVLEEIRDALVDIAAAIREHPSIDPKAVNPQWHKKFGDES